jgi:hypothetical protein
VCFFHVILFGSCNTKKNVGRFNKQGVKKMLITAKRRYCPLCEFLYTAKRD